MRTTALVALGLTGSMLSVSECFGVLSNTMRPPPLRNTHRSRNNHYYFATNSHSSSNEPINNFGLDDRFERWRFLQQVLDEDCDGAETNKVLAALFQDVMKAPSQRPVFQNQHATMLCAEQKSRMEHVTTPAALKLLEQLLNGDIQEWPKHSMGTPASDLVDDLNALLPDPDDDEDAVRSLWDTIHEIHGRESVKLNEQQGNSTVWKSRCLVARILLHYDFLTHGVVIE